MNVIEAIKTRHSVRHYRDEKISPNDLHALLDAAIRRPSAGGLRSVVVRVVDNPIVKELLCHAALDQRAIIEAAFCLVLTCDFIRCRGKYGRRGTRYIYMEAGHMAQNIALVAIELNLGSVMIGAFRDNDVKRVLNIEDEPLYIIPIGRPA